MSIYSSRLFYIYISIHLSYSFIYLRTLTYPSYIITYQFIYPLICLFSFSLSLADRNGLPPPDLNNLGLEAPGYDPRRGDFQRPPLNGTALSQRDQGPCRSPGRVEPGNLTCYSCKLDFRPRNYKWDHPCLGRHSGLTVNPDYLVACGPNDKYCRVGVPFALS